MNIKTKAIGIAASIIVAACILSCNRNRVESDYRDKWCGEWDMTRLHTVSGTTDTTYYIGTISKCGSDSIRIRFADGGCDCFNIPSPSPTCDYMDFLAFDGTETIVLNDVRYQMPQWNYYTKYSGFLTTDSLYLRWSFNSTSSVSDYTVLNGVEYTLSGTKIK